MNLKKTEKQAAAIATALWALPFVWFGGVFLYARDVSNAKYNTNAFWDNMIGWTIGVLMLAAIAVGIGVGIYAGWRHSWKRISYKLERRQRGY
jgi:transposase